MNLWLRYQSYAEGDVITYGTFSKFVERIKWAWMNYTRKYLLGIKSPLDRSNIGTNRQTKTDLNLRPIYHRKDDRSDAHLFLGLLAYWIVNTIRYQMKKVNEARKKADPNPKAEYPTPYWTEIARIMQTQKSVTSEAVNALAFSY